MVCFIINWLYSYSFILLFQVGRQKVRNMNTKLNNIIYKSYNRNGDKYKKMPRRKFFERPKSSVTRVGYQLNLIAEKALFGLLYL